MTNLTSWVSRHKVALMSGVAAGMVVASAPMAFATDSTIDLTPITGTFAGLGTALVGGIAAAFAVAVTVGALIKGAPIVWRAFWRLAK